MKKAKKLVKKLFSYKVYAWLVISAAGIAVIAHLKGYLSASAIQNESPQSYSAVKSIEKVNQTVFLNVGIQHVEAKTNNTKIPWTDIGIPLSERRLLLF